MTHVNADECLIISMVSPAHTLLSAFRTRPSPHAPLQLYNILECHCQIVSINLEPLACTDLGACRHDRQACGQALQFQWSISKPNKTASPMLTSQCVKDAPSACLHDNA